MEMENNFELHLKKKSCLIRVPKRVICNSFISFLGISQIISKSLFVVNVHLIFYEIESLSRDFIRNFPCSSLFFFFLILLSNVNRCINNMRPQTIQMKLKNVFQRQRKRQKFNLISFFEIRYDM